MDGFDIGLVGMGSGRDALMLRAEGSDGGGEVSPGTVGLQFADELAAVVTLPGEVAEDNAAALQVGLKALSEQGAGLGRAPGSKGEERQVAADLASGVLHGGPVKGLHLQPGVRDIVEIRGVGGDLWE